MPMKTANCIVILLALAACSQKSSGPVREPAQNGAAASREPHVAEQKPASNALGDEKPDSAVADKPADRLPRGYTRELSVLFLEDRFRFEARFLNETLKRDNGLAYQAFFCHAQEGWTQPTSRWSDEVKRRVHPLKRPFYNALEDEVITEQKDFLSLGYDVIILGDIDPESPFWSTEYWDWLDTWVRQGGGLILLSGNTHNPRSYKNFPKFCDLCPVSPEMPEGREVLVDTTTLKYIARTESGIKHELFNISSEADRRDELLGRMVDGKFQAGELHGFYWYQAPGKVVEGATVLARVAREGQTTDNGDALIVAHDVGKGRVLYLGTDDFHYWRAFVGDFYFRLFWQNAIRWAADDPGK